MIRVGERELLSRVKEHIRSVRVGASAYILVVGIGTFVLLRMLYSFPRFSDGNIYLYLSSLISQGSVPYVDFFFTSPPLILYAFTLFGMLFGFSRQSFNLFRYC